MIGDKRGLAIAILGKGKDPVPSDPMAAPSDGLSAAAGDLFDALRANDREAFVAAMENLLSIHAARKMTEEMGEME